MSQPSNRLPGEDRAYHLRRLEEERVRAEAATDPCVRLIHLRLADAYAARVGELTSIAPRAQETAE